jgi:hypothetical protein
MSQQPSYRCPWCLRETFHDVDIANSYCPCCGSDAIPLPKSCEHRPKTEGEIRGLAMFYLVQGVVLGARSIGLDVTREEVEQALRRGTPERPGQDVVRELLEHKLTERQAPGNKE